MTTDSTPQPAPRDTLPAPASAEQKLAEAVKEIIEPLARRYDATDYKPGEGVNVPTPWAVYAKASAFLASYKQSEADRG